MRPRMYGSSASHSFLINTSPGPGASAGASTILKLSSVTEPCGRLASNTCLFSAAIQCSLCPCSGEAFEMMLGVAKLLRDRRQPAKRVADFQFVAHAHATVKLDRFLADLAAG